MSSGDDTIRQLARELHESERSRVQVEHFSKRPVPAKKGDAFAADYGPLGRFTFQFT